MKKQAVFIFLFLLKTACLFSQGIDAVWPIGYGCCQPDFGTENLDFRSGSLTVNSVSRHINLDITNGSVADAAGNLLFVSNGCFIFNAADDTMLNGSGLNPCYYTNSRQEYGLTIAQANLVIPSLTDSNQYILLHNTMDDFLNTGASFNLYYSVVDMTLDGGLGGVVSKNNIIYTDSMVPGRITACRHANGRDWWIFVHKVYSGDVFEFLYTPNGFYGPWMQSLGTWRNIGPGQICFNPQGSKVAYYDALHGLDLADFDRCTGNYANQINLTLNDSDQIAGGVAFSSSGRYLYVCNSTHMYQFDTWQTNLDSTKVLLGMYDHFYDTLNQVSLGTYFFLPQLALDNKIYISATNSVHYMHVINSPDNAGLSANFCQHCLQLPALNAFTIPNFPNYRLGPLSGSVCDTLTGIISDVAGKVNFSIYPNPSDEFTTITNLRNVGAILSIYNSSGKLELTQKIEPANYEIQINTSGIATGIYHCRMESEGNNSVMVKLIVIH